MTKQRFSSKLLAFLMAMLILLVSLPTYAFASLIDYSTTENQVGVIENEENEASFAQSEAYVLEEDISLREENVKHFKLSDGTVKAVSYAQPVHYMDENGKWIDIDNALTLNGNEYSAKNKQEIKFANKSGSTGLVSIKDGEYKIDFTPLNANKVSVEIENPQENNSRKFDDVKKLGNLISYATYANIYDGVDLEYILVGNNIKENIIVKEKQSEYTYSFEIKLNKLNAELVDNAVILTDSKTGETVYEIPAPYMLDASGEYSTDVEYALTKNGKWKYTLTVTASPEWINDEGRQFPVTIDPTLVFDVDVDTIIMRDNDDYSEMQSLIIGNFMWGQLDSKAFMKFKNLPTIPNGSTLIKTELTFYVNYVENSNNVNFEIGIYNATKNWADGDFPTYANSGDYHESSTTIKQSITTTGLYTWNITEIYKSWENINNGLCIKAVQLPEDEIVYAYIGSMENIYNTVPIIEIEYFNVMGIENYYAYAENVLGEYGKSYVNLYNGALTYINKLTSIEISENLTYDINMVYNSIEKKWTPSFDESIKLFNDDGKALYGVDESNNGVGIERYIWEDSDGTYHAFTPYLEKNVFGAYAQYEYSPAGDWWQVSDPTVFYPEDNINYVLMQTENDEFILRDYEGNQKMFDDFGKLSKICDEQGNTIHINNYLGGNCIAAIYKKENDGSIVFLAKMSYDLNGNLIHLVDMQNQLEVSIAWGSNLRINSISYYRTNQAPFNIIEFMHYSDRSLRRAIYTNENAYLSYNYNSNNEVNVVSNYEYVDDNYENRELQRKIEITETEGKTISTDYGADLELGTNDDIGIEYTFDSKGRILTKSTEPEERTYKESILPDPAYYDIVYSQNIYDNGFNLAKYDMQTRKTEFLSFDVQNISNTSSIVTNPSSIIYNTVENTQNSPYNMVCQILAYYDGREEPVPSSGFLCGPNSIIMSGHAVREEIGGNNIFDFRFANKIEVIPGRYINNNGTPQEPFGIYEVTSIYISKEYYYVLDEENDESVEYDWAVCVLEESVDDRLDYFDIMVAPDDISAHYIEIIGYYNLVMRWSKGQITECAERRIYYNPATNNGISGSPVFFNNGNYTVIAIHTTGDSNRGGTRINSLIYGLVNYLNE